MKYIMYLSMFQLIMKSSWLSLYSVFCLHVIIASQNMLSHSAYITAKWTVIYCTFSVRLQHSGISTSVKMCIVQTELILAFKHALYCFNLVPNPILKDMSQKLQSRNLHQDWPTRECARVVFLHPRTRSVLKVCETSDFSLCYYLAIQQLRFTYNSMEN